MVVKFEWHFGAEILFKQQKLKVCTVLVFSQKFANHLK